MTDYSQLKDSILEQAHEKGRKLVAEATAKIQAEAQLQEAHLVEEKLHQRTVQLQTIERRLQRESQQIEIKAPIDIGHQATGLKRVVCGCLPGKWRLGHAKKSLHFCIAFFLAMQIKQWS